jgi:hypothetical protein
MPGKISWLDKSYKLTGKFSPIVIIEFYWQPSTNMRNISGAKLAVNLTSFFSFNDKHG